MAKKRTSRSSRRAGGKIAAGKKVLKRKLIAAEGKGQSLKASDVKVVGRKLRASTSGLLFGTRTPKRIHDCDPSDSIVWIDADGRDHVQAIDMDANDTGSHDISSDSDA
jgi:hypothetical protein